MSTNELPENFSYIIYRDLHDDIKNFTNNELIDHYLYYGKNENRFYNFNCYINNNKNRPIYNLNIPNNFNHSLYRYIHADLENFTNEDLEFHYYLYGKNENRLYTFDNISLDFDIGKYRNNFKKITTDLNQLENYSYKINYIDYILYINLDRSINRYLEINKILKNIEIKYSKISAIDGKIIENLKDKIDVNFERLMSNYEIACTLSHIKTINYCKYLKGNYFMICEDDISFYNLKYFKHDLKNIITNCPTFDILLLYKTTLLNHDNLYIKWYPEISGAVCYIISRNGINKLINLAKYNYTKNNFSFDKNINFDVSDVYLYKNLNTYVYKYNFISTACDDSSIHPTHLFNHIYSNISNLNLIINDLN